MGIILGANMLYQLFDEKYYRDVNGGILEVFGVMFSRDLKMYVPLERAGYWSIGDS
jgi:hypothetical protein